MRVWYSSAPPVGVIVSWLKEPPSTVQVAVIVIGHEGGQDLRGLVGGMVEDAAVVPALAYVHGLAFTLS